MNERATKNHKEIFQKKFPYDDVVSNPFIATQAMGYLEALEQFLPTDEWIIVYKKKIASIILEFVIKEILDEQIRWVIN